MTFLQPWLLLALPLVALPVIIHLINQQRFQSVEWAAMMFLLSAKALSRGYSRLRQWLILLLRMLAVAAVILAVSRPLSQGWLAAAGGDRSGTSIVLLDRSPSMSQASGAGGESKLMTARRQVAAALETLGTNRVVLIDSVSGKPQELASPREIERVSQAEPAAAAADLPLLLQAACDQIGATKSAAGTIWICSDQRANDWKVADPAWPVIRETLAKMPQSVRLTLLAYTEPAAENLAVRVTQAVLEPRGKAWELLLDIAIRRQADGGPARVPVQIELGPARSTVEVELTGTESVLARHAIPIDAAALAQTATMADGAEGDRDSAQANGWGRVSIPKDSNPADNDFYVAFGTPPIRRTLVVTEDSQAGVQTKRTLDGVAKPVLLPWLQIPHHWVAVHCTHHCFLQHVHHRLQWAHDWVLPKCCHFLSTGKAHLRRAQVGVSVTTLEVAEEARHRQDATHLVAQHIGKVISLWVLQHVQDAGDVLQRSLVLQ
jgi:hypothetical protein